MDALIIEIVKKILATTTEFLVVGAYARDELCKKAKVALGGETEDLDITVVVPDESAFKTLKESLRTSGFIDGSRSITMIYKGFPVDLVPFGGIARDAMVHLDNERNRPINVAGFEQALANALPLSIEDHTFRIPSKEYFIYLKFRAYMDRQSQKDATDLFIFFRHNAKFFPTLEDESMDQYAALSERIPSLNFADYLFYSLGQRLAIQWQNNLTEPVGMFLEREFANPASTFFAHFPNFPHITGRQAIKLFHQGLRGLELTIPNEEE